MNRQSLLCRFFYVLHGGRPKRKTPNPPKTAGLRLCAAFRCAIGLYPAFRQIKTGKAAAESARVSHPAPPLPLLRAERDHRHNP